MKTNHLKTALIALIISVGTLFTYEWVKHENTDPVIKVEHVTATPAAATLFTKDENGEVIPLDFTEVAAKVTDAVVHIKSTQTADFNTGYDQRNAPNPFDDFFRDFFGNPERPQNPRERQQPRARVGTGSGVMINADGYIVTNNHVIADASDIEVTLNDNRTYKATVIGTDPTTDLALLQIQENGLPHLSFVNSDEVKVGEWVIAVGNPFNLTSTVTAGIVSAKGRNINILREQFAIESFIQTDAAINPGNSGGALVNLQGDLMGINTAIASPTGAYSGYGFAVPSNLVRKVIEDLMEYGAVQRGVLGVLIRNVDANLKEAYNLDVNAGALVDSLLENSAASAAGIQPKDVIVRVNGLEVNNSSRLQELIAGFRPGDEVSITVNRNGQEKVFPVVLNNRAGNKELAINENQDVFRSLGAELVDVSDELADKLDINGGVQVRKLYPGILRQNTQIRPGFIITKVDGTKVNNLSDFTRIIEQKIGGVMLEGVYEDEPGTKYYAFGMDEN